MTFPLSCSATSKRKIRTSSPGSLSAASERHVEQVRGQLEGKNLNEKVAALAEILDAEGYMAEFEKLPDDSYRVTLCNCAIWPVASLYGAACSTELEFLRAVFPEADVQRVEHKVAGAHVCGYLLGHRAAQPLAPDEQSKREMTSA